MRIAQGTLESAAERRVKKNLSNVRYTKARHDSALAPVKNERFLGFPAGQSKIAVRNNEGAPLLNERLVSPEQGCAGGGA